MKARIRLLFLVFWVSFQARGAGSIDLFLGVGAVRIGEQASYYKDSVGDTQIQDMIQLSASHWTQIPKRGFAKPFDAKPYWIKIPVNCTKTGVFFLRSSYVILEDFELFIHVPEKDSIIRLGELGIRHEIEKSKIIHRSLIFRMHLEKGNSYDLYLRLNKRFSTRVLPLYIHDSSSLLQVTSADDRQSGIVYGVFLFLIFQGVVLWLYFKEHIYAHYIGYVVSTLLIMFMADGSFRLYFPSAFFDEVHFTTYFILPICFFFVFNIVFDLLNTRILFPKLVWWTWFFILLSLMFSLSNTIGFFFVPSYPLIIFRLTTLVVLSYPILFAIICLKTYFLNRNNQALVLLFLFSMVLIFIILFGLLPFINYQFERFMSFKWMILFEGGSLMLLINRDLYLNKIAKIRLLEDLNEQKELVTQRYLEGLLDERNRIATDLHDGLSAKISAYKIQLSGFKFSENEQKIKALAHLDELHQEIRNASHALSPILLKDREIKQILEDFILKIEDSDLDLVVDYSFELTENQIRSPHKEILYFTVLELINNVLKHAQAKNLKIQLTEHAHTYVLVVEDDGVGYQSNGTQSAGIGIKSIQQRAEFLNGKFQIEHLTNGVKHTFTIQKKSPENQ